VIRLRKGKDGTYQVGFGGYSSRENVRRAAGGKGRRRGPAATAPVSSVAAQPLSGRDAATAMTVGGREGGRWCLEWRRFGGGG
jgi:hypothetical protein